MPSATTASPVSAASRAVDRTMAAELLSTSMLATRERSSFRIRAGMRRR